jgi:hypothetical protein
MRKTVEHTSQSSVEVLVAEVVVMAAALLVAMEVTANDLERERTLLFPSAVHACRRPMDS